MKNIKYMTQEECIQDYLLFHDANINELETWINYHKDFCIRRIGTIGATSLVCYKYDENEKKYYE